MTATTTVAIEPISTLHGYRLSPQQRRVWQQLHEGFPTHAQIVLRCSGKAQHDQLRDALLRSAQRHEILRTTFRRLPGMTLPVQVVNERQDVAWEVRDLSACDLSAAALVAEAQQAEQQSAFDPERGPMWRALLLSPPGQEQFLILTSSRLVADQKTLHQLARELAQHCAGVACDEAAEEITQYIQFAEWHNELLAASTQNSEAAGRAFWRGQNFAEGFALKLPGECKVPLETEATRETLSHRLPAATVTAIAALARAQAVAPEAVLLACLAALAARLSEDAEFVLGVQVDGRSSAEVQHACGPFAKTAPLACRVNPQTAFVDLLRQIETERLTAHAWQDELTWDLLNSSSTSLNFSFDDALALPQAGRTSISLWRQDASPEPCKLGLVVDAGAQAWRLTWHYDARRLTGSVVEAIAEGFDALLEDALQHPMTAAGELAVIGARQQRQLVLEFNQTAAEYPREQCIHHLIEAQARQHPHRIAVQSANDTHARLSYAELNAQANRLAHYLQRLGVGPESRVGLCVERKSEMIVGILAILKAGGAYVPLNPELPPERLAFMLADADVAVLLTQAHLRSRLPRAPRTLCLNGDECLAWATESADNPVSDVTAAHLAYVIYTSGSTGQPKGVLVTHRNLVHSTTARLRYYRAPVSNFMLVSPVAFDSSVAGIFGALCQGGTLTLASENFQHDADGFADQLGRLQVSHLLCIPSLYHALLEPLCRRDLSALRAVIVAGESCSRRLVNRHHELFPRVVLFNEYGPTEASVWSTVEECAPDAADAPVLIGRPIANTQAYLLDERGRLAPLGAAGELVLGGEGIARGYLNRPELTAEWFIPDQFSSQPGARLYRTGDLARFQPDGKLEFLGRRDGQVKLRGFRIELEEIETALRQHPAVRDSAVAVRPIAAGTNSGPTGAGSELEADRFALLLAELEGLSEDEAAIALESEERRNADAADPMMRRTRRTQQFDLSLTIKDEAFIRPPRNAQREWLLNQALSEFADDLSQLDLLAARFVPGAEADLSALVHDRSLAVLSEQEIMEDWQIPLMRKMSEAVSAGAGRILEVGFGRGVSASLIQERGAVSHTIIECNEHVIENYFRPWQRRHVGRDIRLLQAKWQDVVDQLDFFDGILFHAYPLTPHEVQQHAAGAATFAGDFFSVAAAHLQPGGVFTYLTHEMDSLSRRHQRLLLTHFRSFGVCLEPLQLPADCRDWWWADVMAVVTAHK